MKLKTQNSKFKTQKASAGLQNLVRWLPVVLATLFVVALAVQLVRGKLWIVGPVGVWGFLAATVLATLAVHGRGLVRRVWLWTAANASAYGVALVGLSLIGLWIRIWGQHNGLPYIIPADENLIVDVGTRILKTGDFDPNMYYYPSFYLYLQTLVAGAHFLWGSFTGLYANINALPDRTYAITTAPQMYLWERTVTAIIGAGAIPLAYALVKRMWHDRRAALLAAGFVTFSTLATEHSHYVAVDMPTAVFALAALWPAWNIVEKGRVRDYVWAGVLAGLAFGTKWNGVTVIVLPLAAHLLRLVRLRPVGTFALPSIIKRYISPKLLLTLLVFSLTFLIITPYIFARIKGYSDAFGTNITKYRLSTADYATDYPWIGNLQAIWEDSLMLFGLGVGGVVLAAFRRRLSDLLLLCFPLIYLLSINGYRLIYRRNVLPLTLYFALFAALFTIWAWDYLRFTIYDLRLKKRSGVRSQVSGREAFPIVNRKSEIVNLFVVLLTLIAAMAGPMWNIAYGNQFNEQPFSYARVEDWLKQQAGPGALKLVEMRSQQWGDYPNTLAYFDDKGANDFALSYYRERGIQYVAINRDRVGSVKPGSYPELLQPSLIAQEFPTKTVERPGPAYTVVRTGVTPDTLKLQQPIGREFGGKLKLLGLNIGAVKAVNEVFLPAAGAVKVNEWPSFKPGETVGLSLYWQVLASVPQDYTFFVQLRPVINPDANVANRDTAPLQGDYPTSRWKVGEIVTDNPNLPLPANLPPGEYNLVMGLYLNDGQFTPLLLDDGASSITLGPIKVGGK